jgi:hypothetical protein
VTGGRPWLPHEIAWLREWYGVLLVEDLAQALRRGVPGVRTKILELKLFCRTRWTPELDEFLALLYPDTAARDLAQVMGATPAAIRRRAEQLGVEKRADFAAEHARRITLARSPFTPEVAAAIEQLYPKTPTEDLAQRLGLPVARIQAYASKHGWNKTPAFLTQAGKARAADPDHPMHSTGFHKGLVPWNTGHKGMQVHPNAVATQFKKGQMPVTWKPIGSYRVNCDGYLDRKVSDTGYAPRDWRPVHQLVWIEAHGPIPELHVVRFKPGMKTTDAQLLTVDRLECISRKEHARRNAWHANLPPDLRKLMGARIALSRAIARTQKELEHGHE